VGTDISGSWYFYTIAAASMVFAKTETTAVRVEVCSGLTKVISTVGEGFETPGPGDTVKGAVAYVVVVALRDLDLPKFS